MLIRRRDVEYMPPLHKPEFTLAFTSISLVNTMQPLRRFELPLQPDQVPSGYGWDGRAMSTRSTTSAFRTVVPTRDTFLGRPSCVVCGGHISTNSCHIIPPNETDTVSSKIHLKLIALILIWTAVDQSQANGMDPWRG